MPPVPVPLRLLLLGAELLVALVQLDLSSPALADGEKRQLPARLGDLLVITECLLAHDVCSDLVWLAGVFATVALLGHDHALVVVAASLRLVAIVVVVLCHSNCCSQVCRLFTVRTLLSIMAHQL